MDHQGDQAAEMPHQQSAHRSVEAADGEMHATTGGAAAAGALTGGVIGLSGGPIGAAIGALGGALVGVAAERMMHGDEEPVASGMVNEAHYVNEAHVPTQDVQVDHADVVLQTDRQPEPPG